MPFRHNIAFNSGNGICCRDRPCVDNGIPVVYLNIDESRGTIRDMINSPDHSVFCYGAVSIDVPEDFHYCDLPGKTCESVEDLSMSIRGRGNSTWMLGDKKPFKIKLDETGEYDAEIKKPANPLLKSIYITVTIAVAAIAAVVFFLSSDLSGKMRFSGDRTILMVILAAAAAVFTFLTVIKSSTPSADEAYDTDDIDDTDDQE